MLVADDLAARYSVWALLRFRRDIHTIATVCSSSEALMLARSRRPHVFLISATLSHGDWSALATGLKQLVRPPRVLVFADAVDTDLAAAAFVAGADGLLWRYADADQQAGVIRRVVTGELHFPDLQPDGVLALLDRVESRDRPIVAMLLRGIPPDDVARTLGISARALELRRSRIRKTLAGLSGIGVIALEDRVSASARARAACGSRRRVAVS